MKNKKNQPYRTISLPNDLYEEIEEHIKNNPQYVSNASFIRVAIAEKLKQDRVPTELEKAEEVMKFLQKYLKDIEKRSTVNTQKEKNKEKISAKNISHASFDRLGIAHVS